MLITFFKDTKYPFSLEAGHTIRVGDLKTVLRFEGFSFWTKVKFGNGPILQDFLWSFDMNATDLKNYFEAFFFPIDIIQSGVIQSRGYNLSLKQKWNISFRTQEWFEINTPKDILCGYNNTCDHFEFGVFDMN